MKKQIKNEESEKKKRTAVPAAADKNSDNSEDRTQNVEKRSHKERVISVLLVFLCTLLFAVAAGIGLALWDLNKSPHDMLDAFMNKAQEQTTDTADVPEEESVSQDAAGQPEDAEEEEESAEETVPLVSTDETAGIGTIVRAGDTDEMITGSNVSDNSLSGNTVSSDNADPDAGYPLPFSTVDVSYFDDALFIGDSRMEGFGLYSGTNA
ncbi:MAG TPA: hypothetical protein PLU43_04700, partial [Lachnospiraceae bacterium]|nr:hypothetical protein [Lachnospiraceae bacterium]